MTYPFPMGHPVENREVPIIVFKPRIFAFFASAPQQPDFSED